MGNLTDPGTSLTHGSFPQSSNLRTSSLIPDPNMSDVKVGQAITPNSTFSRPQNLKSDPFEDKFSSLNIGEDTSVQHQHVHFSTAASTPASVIQTTHLPKHEALPAGQESVQADDERATHTSAEACHQSSLQIREEASSEGPRQGTYQMTQSVSLTSSLNDAALPSPASISPALSPLQTLHSARSVQRKPVNSQPGISRSASMSAVPQLRPVNASQGAVLQRGVTRVPGSMPNHLSRDGSGPLYSNTPLSAIVESGTPEGLVSLVQRNPLDPKNMHCIICFRLIYSGESFDACITCFSYPQQKAVQFCCSCKAAATTHFDGNTHTRVNSRILRSEYVFSAGTNPRFHTHSLDYAIGKPR
jgi:hypothetical protein